MKSASPTSPRRPPAPRRSARGAGTSDLDVIAQLVVTLALLVFAYVLHDDEPALAGVTAGAAVSHWLRESAEIGRARSRSR